MTELELKLTTISKQKIQSKITFLNINFNDCKGGSNSYQVKEVRDVNNSLNESVHASLKALDISFTNIKLESCNSHDTPVGATLQNL